MSLFFTSETNINGKREFSAHRWRCIRATCCEMDHTGPTLGDTTQNWYEIIVQRENCLKFKRIVPI